MSLEAMKYPIGRFVPPQVHSPAQREAAIAAIERVAEAMAAAVAGLDDAQLDTPYREGGWTMRQVVHHLADANMHMFLRFKFALAEKNPAIAAFEENDWAETPDSRTAPVELSLAVLRAVNARWVHILRGMSEADFARTFRHPVKGEVSLDAGLALYSWHGTHHAVQLASLRQRMGW